MKSFLPTLSRATVTVAAERHLIHQPSIVIHAVFMEPILPALIGATATE